MPSYDPFEGAKAVNDESKKGLLQAIATGGAAAAKAYEDAQKGVDTFKHEALGRASTRAQITGQNLGGADTNAIMDTAGRHTNYLGAQNAATQSHLQGIGASADSFLTKVNAIHPFMQSQNNQKGLDREAGLQAAIASNQAQIDADKAAATLSHDREKELINLRALVGGGSGGGGGGAGGAGRAGGKAPAAPKPKAADLLGQARSFADKGPASFDETKEEVVKNYPITNDILMTAQDRYAFNKNKGIVTSPEIELAKIIGEAHNLTPAQVSAILTPKVISDAIKSAPPLAPAGPRQPGNIDKGWLTGVQKLTPVRADEILRAPEVRQAQEFLPTLATLKRDPNSGRIVDGKAAENIMGKTPREAFEMWLGSVPGIKSMKTALRDYYGPYLDSLIRR